MEDREPKADPNALEWAVAELEQLRDEALAKIEKAKTFGEVREALRELAMRAAQVGEQYAHRKETIPPRRSPSRSGVVEMVTGLSALDPDLFPWRRK